MEAPTPSNFTFIKKQLTSEQGNLCSLIVSFTNNKFEFTIEKTGKIFKDKFKKDYTMSQIQENKKKYYNILSFLRHLGKSLKN